MAPLLDDLRPPYRIAFDNARDPYTARNALGITSLGGGGGAPIDAEYIVAVDDPTLSNDRVLTDTATVTWDFSTPGQAKATAVGGGNVSNSGAPTVGQYAKWTDATHIQGVAPATVLSDIGAQPAGSYQPLDADLTAIAALTGTNTIYYRSAIDTWSPVTIGGNLTFAGGTLDAAAGTANAVPSCGRLDLVSATALRFTPYNGDRIKINGTIYAIPSAGIAGLTNGGLSASTLYYVYAYNNSGTITGEFSTTTHATSATAGNVGTEIKSGDNTRTLIGMAWTNASAQFSYLTTASWFNRVNVANALAASAAGTVAVQTFVCWANDCVTLSYEFTSTNAVQYAFYTSQHSVDGGPVSVGHRTDLCIANGGVTGSGTYLVPLSEGKHTYGVAIGNNGTLTTLTAVTNVMFRG